MSDLFLFVLALITLCSMTFFAPIGGAIGAVIVLVHGYVLMLVMFLFGYEQAKRVWKIK